MCFAPQRRALFRHLNSQKCSRADVFCTFWLGNLLRATMACTFSASQLPKVVRTWSVFSLFTCKCASRHNGVRALFRHRNFQKWSEPGVLCTFWLGNVLRATTACTFPASQLPKVVSTSNGATNRGKTTVFRDFPTFSRTYIFFFLTLCLLWSSLFCSSLLSILLLHLCFSSVHIVGSLISKLPSISLG